MWEDKVRTFRWDVPDFSLSQSVKNALLFYMVFLIEYAIMNQKRSVNNFSMTIGRGEKDYGKEMETRSWNRACGSSGGANIRLQGSDQNESVKKGL